MQLTRRLAGLFFLGIVPLLFSGYAPWLLWVALAYNVVLVGMALTDHLLTPDPAHIISAERIVEDKLSLGVENIGERRLCVTLATDAIQLGPRRGATALK